MKKELKFRCSKHKTNRGFIDDKGKWYCYYCLKENKYLNIDGVLLKEKKFRGYTIRIIDKTEGNNKKVVIEVFNTKHKLVDTFSSRDLSVCLREFENIINRLNSRSYRPSRNSNRNDPLGLIIPQWAESRYEST